MRYAIEKDEGFGLIEIVVSMFVLAILALSLLPLLIQGIKQSAATATLVTASQIVQEQMEIARTRGTSCAAVRTYATGVASSVTDPRGVVLQPTNTAGACPSSYPGTLVFTSKVTRGDTGAQLATAATRIFVTAP